MFRRQVVRALLAAAPLVIAVAALPGCSNTPQNPVAVGTNIWVGYEPGYLAEREGLFGDATVNLRQYQSATQVLRAFRNKAIDVAALTLDEALMLHHSGIPIRIFLVTDISAGADAIMAKPEITSVRDLAGKRVGVENSALGEYMLARALQLHGVKESDVHEVSLTADQTVDYYRTGKVDAVVTFEPFKSKLYQAGARKVFDSREIPDEVVDVLVAREDFAAENPEAVKAIASGWLAAVEIVNRRNPKAIAEMADRLGLSADDVEHALADLDIPNGKENNRLLSGEASQVARAAQKLLPMLEQRARTRINFVPREVVTAEFLPDSAK